MEAADPGPMMLVLGLPSDENAPRHARKLVADLVGRLDGRAVDRGTDLALVVSEMVSNAVRHGPPGKLEVRAIATGQMIRIEVGDTGTEPFGLDNHDGRGRMGLAVILALSDRCAVEQRPETLVWCEFDLR
jgi:anti-sigma regulatory factor (Ser/Thr protein kinase)